MMWIHPIWQLMALALALCALWLGWQRLAVAHLGRRGRPFAWKRHVLLGGLALALSLAGLGLGLVMARLTWHAVFITGPHYQLALVLLPLLLFGLISGRIMDRHKAKRRLLPLAHALNNLLVVALCLAQVATGGRVIRDMLLP